MSKRYRMSEVHTRIDILNTMLSLIYNDIGIGKIPISLLLENLKLMLKCLSIEDFKKLDKKERKFIREIYNQNFEICNQNFIILSSYFIEEGEEDV